MHFSNAVLLLISVQYYGQSVLYARTYTPCDDVLPLYRLYTDNNPPGDCNVRRLVNTTTNS